MPFRYFGGKKALAAYYPAPLHKVIIEPFAGSAGYSLWHATPDHQVILIEKDRRVVDLWHRLQAMAIEELLHIECPPRGSWCTDPLINLTQASENTMRSRRFHLSRVSGRMIEKWPGSRSYLATKLPLIRSWTVLHGSYESAPDIAATWHIDPPYAPRRREPAGSRGGGYGPGSTSRDINYGHLSRWAISRAGQVMVCEQDGATWLPFVPFRRSRTTSTAKKIISREVLWIKNSDAICDSVE